MHHCCAHTAAGGGQLQPHSPQMGGSSAAQQFQIAESSLSSPAGSGDTALRELRLHEMSTGDINPLVTVRAACWQPTDLEIPNKSMLRWLKSKDAAEAGFVSFFFFFFWSVFNLQRDRG